MPRVVLVSPSLSENVGAVARSMAALGLSDLRLVEGGGAEPLSERARALAAGAEAEAVLEAARRVATLEEAVAGCALVVASTARPSDGVGRRAIAPEEAAGLLLSAGGPTALVFGPESRGLTNAELSCCQQIATIPMARPGACLNLAHAVTVFAYALSREAGAGREGAPLSEPTAAADRLIAHLAALGVVKPRDRESKRHTLSRILSRLRLDAHEAAMLDGWAWALRKKAGGAP